YQDHSVRPPDRALEDLELPRGESEIFQTELDAALIEQTHDDRFAVQRRENGDADVDLVRQDVRFDATILRQPPLGDIQVRKDFDAGDDGGDHPLRRRLLLVEHAVDAVAHLAAVLERLDVDVRSARPDGLAEDV